MHKILPHSILYDHEVDDNTAYEVPIFLFDNAVAQDSNPEIELSDVADFWREKFSDTDYESFDQWGRLLDRKIENAYVSKWLRDTCSVGCEKNIHIRNISTAETVGMLRDLYESLGYFTDYPRKCVIPLDSAPITASISIEHLLYSSKDKNHISDEPRYPPLRSASDQRMILTGLRTGVISGIEVNIGQEGLVGDLLRSEILSPFEIGRLCCYSFVDRGLNGSVSGRKISNHLIE